MERGQHANLVIRVIFRMRGSWSWTLSLVRALLWWFASQKPTPMVHSTMSTVKWITTLCYRIWSLLPPFSSSSKPRKFTSLIRIIESLIKIKKPLFLHWLESNLNQMENAINSKCSQEEPNVNPSFNQNTDKTASFFVTMTKRLDKKRQNYSRLHLP